VVIHTSIIRPAANRWIHEYLRRLHGGSWEPIHPLLADVLDETYGIMVYQEDVSKTAVALAGFSDVDADGLRKVMARKDREQRLQDYFRRFSEGAQARGVSNAQIQRVWEMILSFEGYSFCKPHSASYARVSFQAAFLTDWFPAEFHSAVISNQGGFYSQFAYVSEARRQGCSILPPDINQSEVRWRGRDRCLRVGWMSLKGLNTETAERIVTERTRRPYHSIADFLVRVRPSEDEARALIHARAFEALHPGRSQAALRWAWCTYRRTTQPGRRAASSDLDLGLDQRPSEIPSPPFAPESPLVLLRREFAALGFLCDLHPMVLFTNVIGKDVVKAHDLPKYTGRSVRVAGFLITGKVVPTPKGEPMEFLTFEDETGLMETVLFPEAYRRFCDMLDYRRPYLLDGQVEEDYGAVTLTISRITPIRPLQSTD
jgi:DNA polymerase-3 subunit alpha/error-prone DNA polymerase